jgi:hypothetical protein
MPTPAQTLASVQKYKEHSIEGCESIQCRNTNIQLWQESQGFVLQFVFNVWLKEASSRLEERHFKTTTIAIAIGTLMQESLGKLHVNNSIAT